MLFRSTWPRQGAGAEGRFGSSAEALSAPQNPGKVRPLEAWRRELPGPAGELRNVWPLSGSVGGRAGRQRCHCLQQEEDIRGGLRVERRCAQLEGTPPGRGLASARREGIRGQRAARARRPPGGPEQEAFGDSYGANGLSAEAPPAPSCLPGESGPHGQRWGRRPGRASTSLCSPVGSGPGPDLVPLRLSLAVPASLFNKAAAAWFRGRRKTRPG